jgi:outer membrane protein
MRHHPISIAARIVLGVLVVATGPGASLARAAGTRALRLAEAVELALEKNPGLAGARQRVAAARAGLQQADAAFWPHVRVSTGYAATDNPVQAFMMTLNQRAFDFGADFNNPSTTDNWNSKLLAQYSLYDGGRNVATRQAARLGAEAFEQSFDAVRNELVFEVTRSFHTIGKAREFVHAAEAAVASMEANVKVARDRFEEGAALKSDVLDAEVRLSEAQENLVRARNALAIAETVFRNVVGVGERENVTAATEILPARLRGQNGNVVQSSDVSARPELLAAQKAVAAAERQVRAARSGHLPRVNAFASYVVDTGDARRYADSWVAGVSVEVDVFDGLLTRGKVAEAQARLEEAREQLRGLELALQLEARQAQLNVEESRARLATTGRAVEQAEESLEITKERYAAGLALLTQLLDAETALTAARQRRAAAEADVLIAEAAVEKALGRIWTGER